VGLHSIDNQFGACKKCHQRLALVFASVAGHLWDLRTEDVPEELIQSVSRARQAFDIGQSFFPQQPQLRRNSNNK
jgi:hypothetical protein